MTESLAEAVLARASEVATLATEDAALGPVYPCAASTGAKDVACIESVLDGYGAKLFRRPLSAEEKSTFVQHFQLVSGALDFREGLRWTLIGLIQSPHTLHRSELGTDGKLSPYEIAAELSYNFAGSPPSSELLARALAGDLDDPAVRVEEAKELLDSPRGREVVCQLFAEWLHFREAQTAVKTGVPADFPALSQRMIFETMRFLDAALFEDRASLEELLTANYTVVDSELAEFYGFEGGSGDLLAGGGERVSRAYGLGILAQGSVLTSAASVAVTSPTRRGLLLLKRLFCEVPGLPEGVNFDLTRSELAGNTTRERLENAHLGAECKSCHSSFDPMGFAFEHMDHVGRYRETETTPAGTFPIDASSEVALLDGKSVDGQKELMRAVATDRRVQLCVSGTFENYFYGSSGSRRAREARSRLVAEGGALVDYLAELAGEPHFIERK